MLLCIDIGNTNIKLGVFEGDRLASRWRIATDRARLADEYGMLLLELLASVGIDRRAVTGCAISSVAPGLTQEFADLARRYVAQEPVIVSASSVTGMEIQTDNPAEVGSDLIVNAVAARRLYGAPVIVIGFGTATTFSVVSVQGHFAGVAIAPGVITGAESLFRAAALLPQVALVRPPHAIGKNTIHSVQAGVLFGQAGLVEGLVRRLQAEVGGGARVVATGGLAEAIARETPAIEVVEPDLTLLGLRLIHEMNREVKPGQ